MRKKFTKTPYFWISSSIEFIRRCLYVGGICPEEMRNSTKLSLSYNTSVMSMESPEYQWCSAAQSGQKRSECSAVCCTVPQRGQIGDVICPMKAWYSAVDVSLLSLSWWIGLCACRGTPGCNPEPRQPAQHPPNTSRPALSVTCHTGSPATQHR